MVLTIIIIIVMLVIGVGLVALYREVGLGMGGGGGERVDARPQQAPSTSSAWLQQAPSTSSAWPQQAPSTSSAWPFGNLTVGSHYAIPTDNTYSGFLALCADDSDALGELHSAAVVAEEWGYPFLVAIAKTPQPNGWIDRLDTLPGNIGQYDIRVDEIRALKPVRLPVVAFLNEGRLLNASATLGSPSSIATSFQHCRYGLRR
ncbi:MAG: hypothetical protein M3065_17295 [Actinomycetota bacterium]|nr:hypothetical protein [Actinomycetota bacterium]